LTTNRLHQIFLVLIALHSFILGGAMLFWSTSTMRLFGWEYTGPLFYPAQTGVFLVLLAGAYLAGLWYRPFAWFLVITKAVAVVFLLTEFYIVELDPPRTLLAAALGDGLMGIAVGGTLILLRKNGKQVVSSAVAD
jgi:hypothetical protein